MNQRDNTGIPDPEQNLRFTARSTAFNLDHPLDERTKSRNNSLEGSPQECSPLVVTLLGDSGPAKAFLVNCILRATTQENDENMSSSSSFGRSRRGSREVEIPFQTDHTYTVSNHFYGQLGDFVQGMALNESLLRSASQEWTIPENLETDHAFMLPETDEMKPTLHIKYGSTTRIFVTYPPLDSLKESVWRLKKMSISSQQSAEKQIRAEYLRRFLAHYSLLLRASCDKVQITEEFIPLVGRTIQYKALGQDFLGSDRFYVRETLRQIYSTIGCFAENITVQIPSPLLRENIQINISDSDSIFRRDRGVCRQNIERSDLLLVMLRPDGVLSEGTKKILTSGASFFTNPVCGRKLIFLPTGPETQLHHRPATLTPDISRSVLDELKGLPGLDLKDDRVRSLVRFLPIRPLNFLVMVASKEAGSTIQGNDDMLEMVLKASNVPKIIQLMRVGAITKHAAPLSAGLHMWMQRRSNYTLDPKDKLDSSVNVFVQLLEQWREKLNCAANQDTLDLFMNTKATRSTEAARNELNSFRQRFMGNERVNTLIQEGQFGGALEKEVSMFLCRELYAEGHSWWSFNVLRETPQIFQAFRNVADQLITECDRIIADPNAQAPRQAYCRRLVNFWRGSDPHALPYFVTSFKQMITEEASSVVERQCVGVVSEYISSALHSQRTVTAYLQLLTVQMNEIPQEAARRIVKSFRHIVSSAIEALHQIQTRLRQVEVNDSPDGDVITANISQTYQIFCKKWEPRRYGATSSMRLFVQEELREKRYLDFSLQGCRTQFHSVAHQVYYKESAHTVVRLLALCEIIQHPQLYQTHIPGDFHEYIIRMNNDREQGDHVTLHAIANAFRIGILLYSPLLFRNPIRIVGRNPIFDIRLGYLNHREYYSLVPWKEARSLDVALSPATPSRYPELTRTRSGGAVKKRRKFGSAVRIQVPTLTRLCIMKIVDCMDMLPILEGALPEELVQPIITEIIARGKLNGIVLQKLLHESILRLDLSNSRITNELCTDVSSFCPHLQEISLANCTNITSEGVRTLARNCSQLEIIDLERCNIDDTGVADLVAMCRNLVSINLTGCTRISPKQLGQISSVPNLQTLSFKNCTQLTEDVFDELSKSLQTLDLSECDQITDTAILNIANNRCSLRNFKLSGKTITDQSLRQFVRTCPDLEELELNGCANISDETVRHLTGMCQNLAKLDLSSCRNITSQAFGPTSSLASHRHLNKLTELNLSSCPQINDEALRFLSTYARDLTVLNVSGCEELSDAGVGMLAHCHSLRHLYLSKCLKITEKSIQQIACGCPRLVGIDLDRCRVSDRAVIALTSRCRHIEEITLSSCPNLTNECFKEFQEGFPHLRMLNINELSHLTEPALASISRCASLTSLHMSRCSALTERSLASIVQGCHLLETLDISHCSNLQLNHIQECLNSLSGLKILILKNFPNFTDTGLYHDVMEELNLSWSSSLNDATLSHLAENCPRLQNVDLAWCTNITEEAVKKLLACCPIVTINIRGTKVPPAAAKVFSQYCNSVLY